MSKYSLRSLCGFVISLTVWLGPAQAQDSLRHNSGQPYLSPEETVKRFTLHEGFEAKVFAAEPELINPIAMCFDERGRVWAIESFEYPKGTPAGQKPKDRIKIYEDTDGDHRADKITLFADGFNLATGIAVGHGGVFVGAAPDLLFIPIDKSGDKPAGPPQKLLTGFGRHDTHELLNTFTWGPDGWLYGCHGVFTHSKVKRVPGVESASPQPESDEPAIDMNAAVWRYHPRTRKFEIFAEGTSNPWGIDFDNRGNMFLTCCVIPHMFHIIPGGRYIRQAGQNRNPYDFGQLKEISDHRHHEESGWAHAGCVVLDTEIWPDELRGSVIFGSIHGNSIKRDVLKPNGSTFVASHAPDFLQSGDKNFRPVYQAIGPDGSIYITDWHDQWPCHQTPPDAWDKERGRIYKIVRKGVKPVPPRDMGKLSNEQLVEELKNPNPYVYRNSLRLLGERQAKSVAPTITDLLVRSGALQSHEVALRALWALHAINELPDSITRTVLRHHNPSVQAWTVRFLSESPERLSVGVEASVEQKSLARQLAIHATQLGPVRLELAAACQRLDAATAMALLEELMVPERSPDDPVVSLMIWFAFEPLVVEHRDEIFSWLDFNASLSRVAANEVLPRVMRRLVATGRPDDLAACLRFAAEQQGSMEQRAALNGLVTALEGRRVVAPEGWTQASAKLRKDSHAAMLAARRRLGASFRDAAVVRESESIALDTNRPVAERLEAVRCIAVAQLPESLEPLESLLASDVPAEVHGEVLRALGGYDSREIPSLVIGQWKSLTDSLRTEALTLLTGRRDWGEAVLDAIANENLTRDDLSAPAAQRIAALKDPQLTAKLEKTWGSVRQQTPAEIDDLIKRMRRVVAAGKGDAEAGREVFQQKCATCHKFNGPGADVGPDITGADRSVEYLLINILDPNRVVGQPYYTHVIATKSGRVVTGKLVSDAPDGITLQGENNKIDVIPRGEIEEHAVKNISVMPEGLPKDMTDQQFRDLIEYVRRK
jgi:putative membrane-bound dehydrogenase-like protein